MANKPLVIDVEARSVPNGSLNEWKALDNKDVFINDILTPMLSAKTDLGSIVSGIPTAFARVDLFTSAIENMASQAHSGAGKSLITYYQELLNEWKGLIAAMALDYSNIDVRRINLAYSDGKDLAHTANIYETKGAFGNMLLERTDRWCDLGLTENETKVPYINLIKYLNKVVGATAPESLLFTSTAYKLEPSPERPWIDINKGKFTDPLRSEMNSEQTSQLYAYVGHLLDNLDKVEQYYAQLPSDLQVKYTSARTILTKWREEIASYASARGHDLSKAAIPPVNGNFSGPFRDLFNFRDVLYTNGEGQIMESATGNLPRAFDPKELLLPNTSKIARIHLGSNYTRNLEALKALPVVVLKAEKKGMPGEYAFFAIPLSALGLNVYGKTVRALTGMAAEGTQVNSTLTAVFDPNISDKNLAVKLTIRTETGRCRTFEEKYTVGNENGIRNQDILIWPNFISRQWNTYYLYSELPHNGTSQSYTAFPVVGDSEDPKFPIMTDGDMRPLLLAERGEITAPKERVNASLEVKYTNAVADNGYRYEIYRSDRPFKGVRLVSPTGTEGGFLMINYSSNPASELPLNLLELPKSLNEVKLGVDFGSTNTSIAYSSNLGEKGFEIRNRRVSLMGIDKRETMRENQVLFFPGGNRPVRSNAIKSTLTLHDQRRLGAMANPNEIETILGREVTGGFPCFEENLPVTDVKPEKITLEYPLGGVITQVYNMKWTDPKKDQMHKQAFLRTLMLQVYAELFADDKVPRRLIWSYPSSMNTPLLTKYQMIWSSLGNLAPVLDGQGHPYPLEISKGPSGLTFSTTPEGFGDGNAGGGFGATADNGFGGAFGGGFGDTGGGFDAFDSSFGEQPAQEAPAASGFGNNADGFGGSFDGGFGGGGFDSPFGDGGFGGGGFGDPRSREPEFPDLKPDDPNRTVKYEPKPLLEGEDNPSLTEATAVANFISTEYADGADTLTLCFDIGGSTTDISALYRLRSGLTMVKQNSMRFAAQLVSGAVRKLPRFQNALLKVCARYKIPMVGLNVGAGGSRYSADTAPYFFDKIVDRLTPEQLADFYQIIEVECPELMYVNMYVTGLLMYYAGQISRKLVEDIARTDPAEKISQNPHTLVRVTFAGKGSQLFSWLATTHARAAQTYYVQLFTQGFGGQTVLRQMLSNWPQIMLPQSLSADTKFEVSKGLAKGDTRLFRPKNDTISEIVGEEGFSVTTQCGKGEQVPLPAFNTFTPEMMSMMGVLFNPPTGPNQAPRFFDFAGTFYNAGAKILGIKDTMNAIIDGIRRINIVQYAQNQPEFREAKQAAETNNAKFDYVVPVIILEGMKFYDTLLDILSHR